MLVCHLCLPLFVDSSGELSPFLLSQLVGKLGLPSAASAPNGALHEIDLEAEVSQAQSAGGGVDHSHERDYGKSAIPR